MTPEPPRRPSAEADAAPSIDDVVEARLDALASPTRRAVHRLLLDADRPVAVAEVAEAVGVSPNMARRHLDALVAVGLVEETREVRHDRGRPRALYVGRPDALPGWGSAGALATLAALLARVHRDQADPYEVGLRHAASMAAAEGLAAIDRLWHELLAGGYEPCVPPGSPDTIVLRTCPVASAAEVDPATVCAIHRGLIDGVLGLDGDEGGVRLSPRPPRQAGCRVRLPGHSVTDALGARACE